MRHQLRRDSEIPSADGILASEHPPFFDFWGVLIGDPPRR